MPKFIDITGLKFGRWIALYRSGNNRHGHPQFFCRCECGSEKIVSSRSLRNGESKSCGCFNKDVHANLCKERGTHFKTGSKVYATWSNMVQRCTNPNNSGYTKYGAKGITVCNSWLKFDAFYSDMGDPPTKKHSIDRIDPKKGYCPENCRWATATKQQNNRTNNRLFTIKGQTKTLSEWCKIYGIHYKTVLRRIGLNWDIESAFATAPKKGRNQYYINQ